MNRKVTLVLTSALLAIGMLAGCAKSGDPQKDTSAPKETAKETAKTESKAQEKVTLKILQFKVEITDKVQKMAEEYTKDHPNVTVEAEVTKDYDALLKTRFASGETPDIFFARGYTNVNDLQEKLADLSGEPWMTQVSDNAKPGMTIDGKLYGFPVAVEGYGFIYNKDLFAKAGITKLPETLDELKAANEKLKANNIPSYSEGYQEWWVLGQHLFNLPFGGVDDPKAFAESVNKGKAKVKDNRLMNGFFDVLDMTINYGKGTPLSTSYDNQVANFASGKTAMMQQGVWTIDSILKVNPKINMGMFAIPLSNDAKDAKLPVDIPAYYVINKQSKQLDEAKKFLIWLHDNGQKYIVDSFHLIPAFKDLKTTDSLGPLAVDLSKYVEKNQTMPWAFNYWPTGANQDFAVALQKYVGKAATKDQTLTEIQSIWEKDLKK
jgi:raffinose/stachyose/melibiose transport system substrate-binding protein